MIEQSSVPVNSSESNHNSAIGYGSMRPSFSYLNAGGSPSGNSNAPSFSYNVSHNGSGFPAPQRAPASMNVGADGTQQMASIGSAPALNQSVPQPVHTSSSPSAISFASNSVSNPNTWMPPTQFQVPTGMPRTPVTAGPPGIPSSTPLHPNVTVQHQTLTPYPSPSPHAAPGAWLQHQPVPGFPRAPFPPYTGIVPGPYPVPHRGVPPQSISMPDIQPPGVSPALSSVGAPTSSVSGSQSIISSGNGDFPPGVDTGNSDETSHETSSREQLHAWTAHRTEAGIVYYYNAITKESTYVKPSGFEGESDKAAVKPSPISWQKLAGTDWTEVATNDGKRYYYNSTTQSSSWRIPGEVTELRKKQEADALNVAADRGPVPATSISTPAANTGGRDATPLRPTIDGGSSSALDLIKKKLQDSGIPATSTGPSFGGATDLDLNGSKPIEVGTQNEITKSKDPNVDDNMSDSSSDSEDDDKGPTKDESIFQFKEMLKERGVAPFSKWEKELPKIVFDPRFKAIASHSARRALFDHYVRTRAEEERKEKRAAQKAALEGYKQLLEEAKEEIDHNTDYQLFKKRWGEDPRFQALDRKERESLLNERVLPLKRAAQEKAQAERAAAVSSFKSLLQDKGDITSTSRWSKVKESVKGDPRYKSVKHEDREKLFNEYVAELKAAEEVVEQKAKAKQEEEEKLKEKERALRKRKEREEQEVEKVRLKARRKEAIESYQALLVETIKDSQASWTESKPKLDKDPQGRAANPNLDKFDLEKLFREHVKSLHERCVGEFRALLTEVITAEAVAQEKDGKTVINSWSTAKQILKSDHRYNKMPRKERESLWRRHAEDIQRKLKPAEEVEKPVEGKSKSSADPAKHVSSSRRAHDRR